MEQEYAVEWHAIVRASSKAEALGFALEILSQIGEDESTVARGFKVEPETEGE